MIEECGQWEGEINRIKKVDGGVGEGIEGLRSGVNGSYLDAIDIEATTRNGGLDVGIFGPEEMMGLQEAEKLVEGIKVELSKLQIKGVGSGGSGLEQ
ncbi:hypothetical protein K469DRAFT_719862 [Zopfia rhizophila CBS 207.26]|uniref:Uncharacterized protein n=1 Tax=Zopfia rhizophila CBS 207.26 TaxID=1314779 RepID=A0A6A6ELX0_9PEZI|nr:hypothetical protein K469DRAFT_719862 [Zopfia rhizophila CBS 207.26]